MAVMMDIEILAFGIAKDILGGSKISFQIVEGTTANELREQLLERYPKFLELRSLAFAVNSEYVDGKQIIKRNDEVVLIPPVSGG